MNCSCPFQRIAARPILVAVALLLAAGSVNNTGAASAPRKRRAPPALPPSAWGDWIESDFPFFSSVLDARLAGTGLPENNLTPRGLVLNLGAGVWVGFDTDLLRVAGIWQGNAVTIRALAPGSYHDPSRKSPGGQFPAPEPDGRVWLANGIYPGWQAGTTLLLADPREPAPSIEEVGRGPLPERMGRLQAIRLTDAGAVMEYTAAGSEIREWMTASIHSGRPVVERHFFVGPSSTPMVLAVGNKAPDSAVTLGVAPGTPAVELAEEQSVWIVRVPPRLHPIGFCVVHAGGSTAPLVAPRPIPSTPPDRRWPQEVTTRVNRSDDREAYVVDDIELPLENPWHRAVRLADIQFLPDGTGYGVTLDGDIWTIRGLSDPGDTVRWSRFASGLHEPMTLAIRDGQIYVFDRNGIWRLRDTNGNGEADVHELFSNAFAQTADMREFPSAIRLAPAGEFVICKGGQQSTTLGKHNGSILRISADGRQATVLGYGFRQPNMGVDPRTGLVIASDQQGQYVPSTPLYIVRDHRFHGFLSPQLPREQYPEPPADPLTWIPHSVDASAVSVAWLYDARMGPLNGAIVHLGFRRPELFRVLLNQRTAKPQAAVVSVTRGFEFPPLSGSVNPADGQFYAAGFQVLGWGTDSTRLAGFGRVRYTGAPSLVPREVVPMDQGILLRFDVDLNPRRATDPASYTVSSWNYERTYKYGSPQLKDDGTPGLDWLTVSSAYLAPDGRSIFVGIPGMKPSMQMRIGWLLATAAGRTFGENAYFTPYELVRFNPRAEGFGDLKVNLEPRTVAARTDTGPTTIEEGRRLYQLFGCMACHSSEETAFSKIGPTWKGLFLRQRTFAGEVGEVVADEAYLRQSILDPPALVVPGYERSEAGMPSYAGVLTDSQIESLLLFIKSLR